MPLLLMTGIPSGGKTMRTLELKQFFEEAGKEVHIVSESEQIKKANFDKNSVYLDSNKEKHIRGLLKSEVLRLITPQNVVILDGLNYIKGYRYELYCGVKTNRSTMCTIHVSCNELQAWNYNQERGNEEDKYTKEVFDALLLRYEEPGNSRWDKPLIRVFSGSELDKIAIMAWLFNTAPPPPNMSTQNAPLSSTNFLYDLDQVTKKIVDSLIQSKNMGARGVVKVDGFPGSEIDISNVTVQQLMVLRRQYITYSKMNTPDAQQVPQLFVQYLKTSLK